VLDDPHQDRIFAPDHLKYAHVEFHLFELLGEVVDLLQYLHLSFEDVALLQRYFSQINEDLLDRDVLAAA
jgi:hypothetical protein